MAIIGASTIQDIPPLVLIDLATKSVEDEPERIYTGSPIIQQKNKTVRIAC